MPSSQTCLGKRVRKDVNYNEDSQALENVVPLKIPKPPSAEVYKGVKKAVPTRSASGHLEFEDHPEFRPNLTPKEVLQLGSFGGTYFRPIHSRVTGKDYDEEWEDLPMDWLKGLNIKRQVAASRYNKAVNKYNAECGGDLDMWEGSGWISKIDPYGWFQWYCRFYQGRRSSDDDRQISRGNGVMGPTGRWRNSLINKVLSSNKRLEDAVEDGSISPKIRQLLQHWGYKLTVQDVKAFAKKKNLM